MLGLLHRKVNGERHRDLVLAAVGGDWPGWQRDLQGSDLLRGDAHGVLARGGFQHGLRAQVGGGAGGETNRQGTAENRHEHDQEIPALFCNSAPEKEADHSKTKHQGQSDRSRPHDLRRRGSRRYVSVDGYSHVPVGAAIRLRSGPGAGNIHRGWICRVEPVPCQCRIGAVSKRACSVRGQVGALQRNREVVGIQLRILARVAVAEYRSQRETGADR